MLTERRFFYEVFGLVVSSEFEMKELKPVEKPSDVDVSVEFAQLGKMKPDAIANFTFSEHRQDIVLPAVAAFVIEGNDTVLVEPKPGVSNDLLAVPFLGPVLALLLHQRGKFVLHGSAIKFGGKAYGFVGDKGAGKSTLAAMLLNNKSVELLTDDLLVISENLEVLCGYQQMKLSDEALGYTDRSLSAVRPPPIDKFPKNQVLLKSNGSIRPVPVGGIFQLSRGKSAEIEPIPTTEAIRVLLRFSYISRFTKRSLSAFERRWMFTTTTAIATTGRVKRLTVPDEISKLEHTLSVLDSL